MPLAAGHRALAYDFGPRERPTRRIVVILDPAGRVVRYSDLRGDLRGPRDASVARNPLGRRTSIAIDFIDLTAVLRNEQGDEPPNGIRAAGPGLLAAPNLGNPAAVAELVRAACSD
jgi:hypothetical protein